MQPLHAAVSEPGQAWARERSERWGRSFPWQTLRESGAQLVFGSDWPVVTQNPFLGMHVAMAGPGAWPAHQAQTLEATLAAYTRDAAYAEFQEDPKGSCAPECRRPALLSGDITEVPPEAIKEIQVALTLCNGRIV